VCDNILEHLANPVETIAFLSSVTARDGVLYVSVPDCGKRFLAAQAQLAESGGPIDISLNPFEHLNYFDLAHLDRLLAAGGFLPIRRTELPEAVNIGLRPEENPGQRTKNYLACAVRLAKYALTAQTIKTVNHQFYRKS